MSTFNNPNDNASDSPNDSSNEIIKQAPLSGHDQDILDQIFSQELYTAASIDGNGKNRNQNQQRQRLVNRPLKEGPEQSAAQLEITAISQAESGNLTEALKLFDQAITYAPSYPSLYNNRAQVLRLMKQNDRAQVDLDRALQLCDEYKEEFPLVRLQALHQRAWLAYGRGEEEQARNDFEEAAQLGSLEAKQMAVRCNPYARLCNNIMQEMLHHLYYSQPSSTFHDDSKQSS